MTALTNNGCAAIGPSTVSEYNFPKLDTLMLEGLSRVSARCTPVRALSLCWVRTLSRTEMLWVGPHPLVIPIAATTHTTIQNLVFLSRMVMTVSTIMEIMNLHTVRASLLKLSILFM